LDDGGVRLCECGCGEPIVGSRRRRFVDDTHRKRFARAVGSNGHKATVDADTDPDMSDMSDTVPEIAAGRCREGLEEWLDGRESSLSQAVVSACRALSDEVDAKPSSSPLWGRYSQLLGQLVEHATSVDEYEQKRTAQAIAFVMGGEVRCHGCERVVSSCPYCHNTAKNMLRWAYPLHPDKAYPPL